jgi:hypothetical protein
MFVRPDGCFFACEECLSLLRQHDILPAPHFYASVLFSAVHIQQIALAALSMR